MEPGEGTPVAGVDPVEPASARRRRPALVPLGAAPWRRAPLLGWRRPGVLLAAAGAVAVVAASLAAVPLFLSSAGTEAVTIQVGERCPRDTGATLTAPVDDPDPLGRPDPFVPVADDLGPATRWGRFDSVLEAGDERTPVVVLSHDGAADHVDLLEGGERPGAALLSDRAVALTAADGRDTVAIGGIPVPVGGVYADLAAGTVDDPFWCTHRTDLLLRGAELIPPRPVVLVDPDTWTRLLPAAMPESVTAVWQAPLRSDVTLGEAAALVDDLGCRGERSPALRWCAGGLPEEDAAMVVQQGLDSSLPFVVDRGHAIRAAVAGGVWPVAGLAALAGAGLVAATALLWCDRRRREVTLLTVRGVGPAAIGVKAVLELVAALVLGGAVGVALAWALVVVAGPSPVIEPSALGWAVALGLGAALGAALVLGVVAALRTRALTTRAPVRRWWRRVPWEVALAVLALLTLASYRRLGAWGTPVADGASVSRIDALGLVFPVLFLTTAVLVAARLLGMVLGPLRRASATWPASAFLAVRRVARYRTAVTGMVVATALAAGVFAYAATIQRSMGATLEAKALVYLGSDVVVRVPQDAAVPAALADRTTSVDLYQHAWVGEQRRQVNVFAIDPATFAAASYWDDTLADESLTELVDRLAEPAQGGRVPALLVGAPAPTVAPAGIGTTVGTEFSIEQVATVDVFPGMRRGSPALFVATPNLERLGVETRVRELRIQGDRAEVLAALDAAGVPYQEVTNADHVVDAVSFLTVSQTFGFLRSLSLAAAALVVGGVAVYLDARRRGRVLGDAFARRMGLRRRDHRRALVLELLAGIGVGGALGAVAALAGAALAHGRLDPLPLIPPAPVLRPATGLLLAVVVVSVATAVISAALAQRAADRDDPVEVLRGGT